MVAKRGLTIALSGNVFAMGPDEELMVIFGALHLVALTLGIVLFVMFLRSGSSRFKPPDDDEGGGGGNDRISDRPKTSPSGGIPLPDAEPAPFRLRSHERLRDLRARPDRRRVAEPAEPSRRRVRR
jgi:hypothetical protein